MQGRPLSEPYVITGQTRPLQYCATVLEGPVVFGLFLSAESHLLGYGWQGRVVLREKAARWGRGDSWGEPRLIDIVKICR